MYVFERFAVALIRNLTANSGYLPNSWADNMYKYRTTPTSLHNNKKNEFGKPIHKITKVCEQKSTNPAANSSTTSM
jgi:hypothetical protein